MAFELRANGGTLFANKERNHPQAPDWTGTALVELDGQMVELRLTAWTKHSEKAGEFLSLNVRIKSTRDNRGDLDRAFGRP
jgi:hypothetical protein